MEKLAVYGGEKAVTKSNPDAFIWPIITKEDEDAALEVLRRGAMSGTDVTFKFEEEFSAWQGTKYALAFMNGTASLLGAMFAVKLGHGDEMIVPSVTYWASANQVYSLGATPVFAELDPITLCIDPTKIEKLISKRTKAIMVVHYLAHPCDMDAIMAIAKKHNIKVIEDVSHAQGGLYKGKKLGTFGDVAAMSLMSGKSLAIGEGGILVTDNREIYERAVAYAHYERFQPGKIETEELKQYVGLPLGGMKGRMHQISSAVGRVQLKYYDERCVEIRKAMNYFWDCLEGTPGIIAHRVDESKGYNMAGWYAAHGIYNPEELGGLPLAKFAEAVRAEGGICGPGANRALHTHPMHQTADIFNQGKPTRIANADRDVRELDKDLIISSEINSLVYSIPWFKKFDKELIEQHANAYKKVAANYKELLKNVKEEDKVVLGGWNFFTSVKK